MTKVKITSLLSTISDFTLLLITQQLQEKYTLYFIIPNRKELCFTKIKYIYIFYSLTHGEDVLSVFIFYLEIGSPVGQAALKLTM